MKNQVSPSIAAVLIALVVVIAGFLIWKSFAPPSEPEVSKIPPGIPGGPPGRPGQTPPNVNPPLTGTGAPTTLPGRR